MSPRVGRGTGAAANPDLLAIAPELESPAIYFTGTSSNNVSTPDAASLDILGTEGTKFLYLPGVAGNSADVPDAAHFTPTSSLSVRAAVALDSYAPSTANEIAAHWLTAGNQLSWLARVNTNGTMQLRLSTDGSTSATPSSTIALPTAAGDLVGLRYDWTASPAEVKFYTKTISASTTAADIASNTGWAQLGTTVTASVPSTALHNSTDLVRIGRHGGTSLSQGKFYAVNVQVDGTTQLDADFTQQAIGATTFTESSSNAATVTVNGTSAKIVDDTCYGYMPGVAGSYFSTPDAAALDITGDIDLRARVALNDWTPPAQAGLVMKLTTTGNQRSYGLNVETGGQVSLRWSPDGTTSLSAVSTVSTGLANGAVKWVRGTLDVDDGSGNHVVQFFLSDDGATWTQLGTTVTTAGTTSIYNSTAPLEIGSITAGASFLAAGKFYRAQVFDGIAGTKVLDVKFDRQIQFASSFVEDTGKTVTVNGNARINRNRDLDIRVRTQPSSWTASSTNKQMFAKRATTGDQRSWLFDHTTLRLLLFYYSYGGTSGTETSRNSGTAVPFADGETGWVRVVLDVDDGAGGHVVTFYTAPDSIDEPTNWTQLGTGTLANVYSLFPGTATPTVGSWADGGAFIGKMYRAVIRNGIDGPVVGDWQARGHLGGVRYTDQTGKVWTINGSAWTGVLG